MIKTDNIALRFFSFILLFSLTGTGISQEGVFMPYKEYNRNSPKKPDPIVIEYVFREFSNQDLYNNAVKTINWFSGFKNPPFKLENAAWYNPALQFNVIDSSSGKKS